MEGDGTPILDEWRQGDLALTPLELPALVLDDDEIVWGAMNAPHGAMLLSQSCDVIRDIEDRPLVTVAALVPATEAEIARAEKLEVPSRLLAEPLRALGLLVDLDATATVHKSVVATWPRTPACETDGQRRKIARALARHRQRFAFPDDFNKLITPVRRWIESKRSKESPQGDFVRALEQVRVRCDKWDEPTELTFLAIMDHPPDAEERPHWEGAANTLEQKAKRDGWPDPEFRVVTYEDISAREYLDSDRLDWDGLSDAG